MSPETIKFITDLSPFGTMTVTVVSAAWILVTYLRTQKDTAITRLFECRKPFLELQLRLYTEAAQVAGKLAVSDIGKEDFERAKYRFWELYWSELAVVEDKQVEAAMVRVGSALGQMQHDDAPRTVLEEAVLNLARALRDGIFAEWGAHIGTNIGSKIKQIASPQP